MVEFRPTLTLGDILTIVSILWVIFSAWKKLRDEMSDRERRIRKVEKQVQEIWSWLLGNKKTREIFGNKLDEIEENGS